MTKTAESIINISNMSSTDVSSPINVSNIRYRDRCSPDINWINPVRARAYRPEFGWNYVDVGDKRWLETFWRQVRHFGDWFHFLLIHTYQLHWPGVPFFKKRHQHHANIINIRALSPTCYFVIFVAQFGSTWMALNELTIFLKYFLDYFFYNL